MKDNIENGMVLGNEDYEEPITQEDYDYYRQDDFRDMEAYEEDVRNG